MSTLLNKVKSQFDALFKEPLPLTLKRDPTRAAQINTADFLNVPESKRGIKETVPPPPKSKREQCGFSRRDVVAILDKIEGYRLARKDVRLLPERDTKMYRELVAGNTTVEALASAHGMSVGAFKIFVADLEKTIIDEAAYLNKCFGVKIVQNLVLVPDDAESANASERELEEARTTDEKAIGASGGAAIGGRLISRGKDSKGNPLKLDTFERGGKMSEEPQEKADFSNKGVEHDDYSEESTA